MLNRLKILLLLGGVAALALTLPACSSDDDPMDPGDDPGDGDTTAPAVIMTEPMDGQLMVDPAGAVMFSFNEAMDPDTAAGAVTMSHGTVSSAVWIDAMSLLVSHTDWPMATQVSVTLGTGLADVAGNPLASPVTVTYWTMSDVLTLMDFSPADGAVDVNRAVSIELLFSDSMNFASLTTGITITDNTKAVRPFTVEEIDGYRFELQPVEPLAATEVTTVTLSTDVQSNGGDNLAAPISFSFTTSDAVDNTPPTILSIDPPSGSTMPGNQAAITLVFSEPMDIQNFAPTMMNGQFGWLISQTLGAIEWNPEGTELTVPLPANLPAGLPLQVKFAGYADANGNVQPAETVWTSTVAGTADPYPVSDGYRWEMMGTWAEGQPGSNIPTDQGEEASYFEFMARGVANQWERREFDDPNYLILDYYEILSVTGAGSDIIGFAEDEGTGFMEFILTGPLTVAEFPFTQGNTWSNSASATLPDGIMDVTMDGEVIGQEDLILIPASSGFEVVWTDVWVVEMDVELSMGGEIMGNDSTRFWFAPGIGIVRELYREDRIHLDNDPGWSESDLWLFLDLD